FTAYLVGGCVRDLLLGMRPKELDVATSAHPNQVKETFRNSRLIGRRFRLAHVFFRGGKIIEVSTFRKSPLDELTDLPQDLLIRHDNVFGTEEEDARRRDFTINALFYEVDGGRVVDHVGGKADLAARLVHTIGDPDVRMREDPVRILRAIRFAAKCGLRIEPGTSAAAGEGSAWADSPTGAARGTTRAAARGRGRCGAAGAARGCGRAGRGPFGAFTRAGRERRGGPGPCPPSRGSAARRRSARRPA